MDKEFEGTDREPFIQDGSFVKCMARLSHISQNSFFFMFTVPLPNQRKSCGGSSHSVAHTHCLVSVACETTARLATSTPSLDISASQTPGPDVCVCSMTKGPGFCRTPTSTRSENLRSLELYWFWSILVGCSLCCRFWFVLSLSHFVSILPSCLPCSIQAQHRSSSSREEDGHIYRECFVSFQKVLLL